MGQQLPELYFFFVLHVTELQPEQCLFFFQLEW